MKQCSKCKEVKELSDFYKNKSCPNGLDYYCKLCKKKATNKAEVHSRYYQKNKKEIIAKAKAYEIANPEKVRENHKLYMRKRRQDPKYRLRQSILALINHHLKQKSKSTNEYLGCSYEEYYVFLENKFTDNMNWSNYGTYWEIDHTIPLSKGGSFHYTNTAPMTISENRKKSNKIKNVTA